MNYSNVCNPISGPAWKLQLRVFVWVVLSLTGSVFCSQQAYAQEQEGGVGLAGKVIVVESLVAIASYAAAEQPKGVGVTTGLLVPMAAYLDDRSSVVTKWTGVIAAEALSYYNFKAHGDESISRDDIIKNNAIGWNIFALAVGISDYLFPVNPEDVRRARKGPQLSYRFNPLTQERGLQLSYRF